VPIRAQSVQPDKGGHGRPGWLLFNGLESRRRESHVGHGSVRVKSLA